MLLLAGCLSQGGPSVTPQATAKASIAGVEYGDNVSVDFIGIVKSTGEVFDTTEEDIAMDPNIPKITGFVPRESYEPLSFIVGSGEIIPEFEEAILGLKEGEEATIELPPEKAFGEVDPNLIVSSPRNAEFSIVEEVSLENYVMAMKKEPIVGDIVNVTPYWSTEITNITNGTVVLTHLPVNDSIVKTAYGPARVTTNGTTIFMRLLPEINTTVYSVYGGIGKIIDFNESFVTVDFNHPLAGETLIFKIKVRNIIKKSETIETS